MKKIVNDILKEELYYDKLDCGLEVFFMPKEGFSKKYAVFATNYGSNELEFIPINENQKIIYWSICCDAFFKHNLCANERK